MRIPGSSTSMGSSWVVATAHGIMAHQFGSSLTHILQQCFSVIAPTTGLFPIEQALLNLGKDGSLENMDAVDALLRACRTFLSRINL
jgi:hypothetical protein